jgi:hypothetical protein
MSEAPRYPNHECACDDADLSQATHPVVSPSGHWVQIPCGFGHRRTVPRARWEAELQRRAAAERRASC